MSQKESFDSFEEMECQSREPIFLESDDSFKTAKCVSKDEKFTIVDQYRSLKDESKRLDDLAIEIRSLILICKQMEECYSKRIIRKDIPVNEAEIRYLHDGTCLLLISIQNVTSEPMKDWILSIHPSHVFPSSSMSSSSCQTIPIETLLPGIRKTFECHVELVEPPILLQFSLIREFQLEDVRKVYQVDGDPLCVTLWDQAQIVKENVNGSFTSSLRLPNALIDLLSGCPDSTVTPSQVIRAVFKVISTDPEVVLLIPSTPSILVKIICTKDGGTAHTLSIGTESSRTHTLLAEQLRLRLIVEMSKLKSRPAKGISILAEMEAPSVEELFQSMLTAFH